MTTGPFFTSILPLFPYSILHEYTSYFSLHPSPPHVFCCKSVREVGEDNKHSPTIIIDNITK